MQAVIIAGGKGTRLRPLTYGCPKPMLPLVDRPFLEWMINRCREADVCDILLNVQYQSRQVIDYFGDGDRFGVKIRYVEESTPLDTAGAIKLAEPYFTGESLIVFNADILTNLDLKALIKFHKDTQADATLTLTRVEDITPFGLVEINSQNQVQAFREKPNAQQAVEFLTQGINTINAGTYVLEPKIFDIYPTGEPLSFERKVFPNVLERGLKMMGFVWDGYWMDMGTPEKYFQAQVDVLAGEVPFDFGDRAEEKQAGVWVAKSASIAEEAVLESPCYIGEYTALGKDAHIPSQTLIGANSLINKQVASGMYATGTLLL
ncbi:NDP-sugar synthase [Pseudanabaena sp. FACHB-1998]|uniref:sugar phosphate nucleotidyltransferase n=1 Tax=Pseudanabaena sp. FACHB-1998 TaxID=2692858 RepID=UPI0016814C39|nr:NDP-sugar synthase [Pseudanabaena sp. FACHB-1998]MBD2177103.1 NDP-sugar synthase [Pseudanabaena sp. FACHB-1998]